MKISQIIKRLLSDWDIDFDFTEEEVKEMEKDMRQISAYDKGKLLKQKLLLFTIYLN